MININYYLYPLSEDYKKLFLEDENQQKEYEKKHQKKAEEPSSLESSSRDEKDFVERQMIFKMDDI